MTRDQIVACYLLDRADSYVTESACWVALADAAKNILLGEHTKSHREGEFDESLVARIRGIQSRGGRAATVHANSGVDPDDFVDDEDDDK